MKSLRIISILVSLLLLGAPVQPASVAARYQPIIRTVLDGYAAQCQHKITQADSLFADALNEALQVKFPLYNAHQLRQLSSRRANKSKRFYDWQSSNEQKIFGLLQVYHIVSKYYAGFRIYPELDWGQLVKASIPPIIESTTIEEYYGILQRLIARLNDNHTWLHLPPDLQQQIDHPPVSVEYIDEKFVMTAVTPTAETIAADLHPGDEIIAIDQIPVTAFFKKRCYLTRRSPRFNVPIFPPRTNCFLVSKTAKSRYR